MDTYSTHRYFRIRTINVILLRPQSRVFAKLRGAQTPFRFTIFSFAPSPVHLISGAPGFPSVPECATESYLRSHSILISPSRAAYPFHSWLCSHGRYF